MTRIETRRGDDESTSPEPELTLTQHVQFLADEIAEQERTIENLQIALVNSRTIGVALGILMAVQKTTRAETFAQLSRQSQRLNRKLVDIADEVEQAGRLP